jgi:hypothetical protein
MTLRKLLKTLVAVGFIALTACTVYIELDYKAPPPSLFEVACTELRVDCTNIVPPTVIYSEVIAPYGAIGLYVHGEPYVYINPLSSGVPFDQIELHETVHYVMYESGILNDRCVSEEAARVITARHFNTEVDWTWRKRYKCPEAV